MGVGVVAAAGASVVLGAYDEVGALIDDGVLMIVEGTGVCIRTSAQRRMQRT